jgi:hypothetical protein
VRCPGDTIHSGYEEYIRIILLLSGRQQRPEQERQYATWTPY